MNTNIAASHPPESGVGNTYVHTLDRQYVFQSGAQQGSLNPMVVG